MPADAGIAVKLGIAVKAVIVVKYSFDEFIYSGRLLFAFVCRGFNTFNQQGNCNIIAYRAIGF